ncbi:MAG: cysteine desulfurase [Inquilinus sp.]|nr:cysteine desulfurase [Inquilinus sp.]
MAPLHASGINDYDVAAIRADFPILSRQVYGRPLVYLDNAASAQKPRQVIDTVSRFYEHDYSNVHRGLHYLSGVATDAYEAAREKVRAFVNAGSEREVIFTRNATEAINLVASSYGRAFLKEGDEVVVSAMEHHANIVPWQMLREAVGIVLKVAPIDDAGNFLFEEFEALLGPRTKLVSITHASNALGSITPAGRIVEAAHARDIPVLLDGSQAVVHRPVDVAALGCDFYVFTGHKLYGPSGIGVLYGREAILDRMPPYQGGGEMIRSVSFDRTEFAELPNKFEAGTPPIAQAIGLGAAIDYVTGLGLDRIAAHEAELLAYATERVSEIPGLTVIGRAEEKASILSFVMDVAHPHDVGTLIDRAGVAARAGHHCAQPLMERFGVAATTRASFGLYNTKAEIDILAEALRGVREMFG